MDIESILSQMTLEEKASILSGRDFSHTKPLDRLGIPAVEMCDGPHGLRKQEGQGDHLGIGASIRTVCYPAACATASSFDRNVLTRLGEALGQECQAENVSMQLGPAINIKRSPLCGRNFEYVSEDPYLAGELATAYIQGLQGKGVSACVKHFACNNQETRRMSADAVMDERTLHEIYLPAFETAVKKGKTRSVMSAYNAINGSYCVENKLLLTDILRKDWGFEGFVVTDWGAIQSRVKGINAGLDLEMPGSGDAPTAQIIKAVQSGELPEEALDEAVRRVLMFIKDSTDLHDAGATVDREANLQVSVAIAEQSAVLMKNDGILPLYKAAKVAFVGEFAKKPRYQGGGSSHINAMELPSAAEAVKAYPVSYTTGFSTKETEPNAALEAEAVEAAKNANAAIIFAGLPDDIETEGVDRADMRLPENQNHLIEAVAAVQPNTVVVLHLGAPVEMPWIGKAKAVLCMYLGGAGVGVAATRILYGDVNPSGKLAETWPIKLEDNPSYLNFPGEEGVTHYREDVFVGYRYYDKKNMGVLFPFGHGLSYTQFEYSGLMLDKGRISDADTLTVTVAVKNIGDQAGSEAVQLYVKNACGVVSRPVRELRGFEKVYLQPGEAKEIHFKLDKRAFAYYEPKIHDWHVAPGDYGIEIGASSRDIRIMASIYVENMKPLPIVFTRHSVIGDVVKTPKGQALMSRMQQARAQQTNAGEELGSTRMVQAMMKEMPLGALCVFGMMNEEQLEGMLAMLNG